MSPSKGGSARGRLLRLQKRIYRSLQAEARELLGEPERAIREYETAHERELSRLGRLAPVGKEGVVRAMREARVSFIADYHTFAQAQRTALRLAQAAVKPGEDWMLGIEMVPSSRQRAIDAFQKGELGEEELLAQIGYDEAWGFPWANYAPLLRWARDQGVRLVGLNLPPEEGREGDLSARDDWAARVLVEKLKRPGRRILVLYGELHVASVHLPAALERVAREAGTEPPPWMTVHQNHDRVYWRLAERGRETSDAVRLARNRFCVVSSTPWAKLQSLVSFAEGGPPGTDEDDATDYHSLLRLQGETISEFLGVAAPSFDTLTLRTIRDAGFLDEIEASGRFTRKELRIIRHHVDRNWRLYLPAEGLAYLGAPSMNGTAELAAAHLQHLRMRSHAFALESPDDFHRLTIESAFRFFGSLVLNPRRKCDLVDDHRKRIILLSAQDGPAAQVERASRELALETLTGDPRRAREIRFSGPGLLAAVAASRYAGRILGMKLHRAVLEGAVTPETARHLCLARADGGHRPFEERFRELRSAVEGVAVSPSKAAIL